MSWLYTLPATLVSPLLMSNLPISQELPGRGTVHQTDLIVQANTTIHQGVLQNGDRVLSFDGSLYDEYEFQGQAGQVVNIEMNSLDFDTYLILIGPNGEWLAQNDDIHSQNLNSAIAIILPETGTYRIMANAYNARGRGNYTLSIAPVSARSPAILSQPVPPIAALVAQPPEAPSANQIADQPAAPVAQANAPTEMAQELLATHNRYRQAVGVDPLAWSDSLANSAQQWANHLAATNSFEHSQGNYGENLWMGSAGRYSYTRMVQAWGDEQEYFIPGEPFPNVSTTGNWADVGHYTQIVWADTREVGCATARANGWDYLVCQYNPPGNFRGERPF